MSQKGPSRRALLGAAVALPVVAAIDGGVAPPPGFTRSPSPAKAGEEWVSALAGFRAAEARVREIEAATAGYGLDEEEALLPAHEAACDAMAGALGRVLLAPVPDVTAFADKLELLFEHELEPGSIDEEVLAAIRGDARRLARV